MANQHELMAEAYRRGILPEDKKKAYEEAMNRGLIPTVGPISETSKSTLSPQHELSQTRSALKERLLERGEKTAEMATRRFAGNVYEDIESIPGTVGLAIGQAAGGALDVLATGTGNAIKTLTPEPIKEFAGGIGRDTVSYWLNTDIGHKGIAALKSGVEKWNKFSQAYPDAAMALEGIVNVSGLGYGKAAAAKIEGEAAGIVSDIRQISTKLDDTLIDNKIGSLARKHIPKAIRPTVVGKTTATGMKKYYDDAASAVESIVENKGNLRLTGEAGEVVTGQAPQNLLQFSEAIDQTKRQIYRQYDELSRNTLGNTVDIKPIVEKLKSFRSKNIRARVFSDDLGTYADDIAERLAVEGGKVGKISAADAQELIQDLNDRLRAYYKTQDARYSTRNYLNANIANDLREQLDKAVTNATGKEYGALKRQYGALKAIEADTNKRLSVEVRKDMKGLLDFTDVFSGSQAVNAIAQKNAPLFLAASTAKTIAGYYRRLKDPNRAVQLLFEEADNLLKQKQGFTPNSFLGSVLMEAKENYDKMKSLKKELPKMEKPYAWNEMGR